MFSAVDICFMCISNNNCNVVDKKIVTQVEYLLPEITIIKMNIPLRICSICENAVDSFSKFKEFCVKNSLLLEARMKEAECNLRMKDAQSSMDKMDHTYSASETQQQADKADVKEDVVSEKTEQNIEEVFIKEEPLQETVDDPEFYDNILQGIPKEEYIIDDIKYSETDKVNDNTIVRQDDTVNNENSVLYSVLTSNTKVDSANKDFDCRICHKLFKYKCQLKQHMKSHEITCSICNKLFKQHSDLQLHMMKVHHEIKNYKCARCNKLFKHKHTLTTHMKIHQGIKDFQCPTCNKMFTQKCTLTRHMKTHTKIKCE